MDRHQGAWRQHRALHALLAAVVDERAEVGEVAERRAEVGALGADLDRVADLGDDHADLAGGHLDPGLLADAVDGPETEAQPGHQQALLVAGLAAAGDGVALGQALAGDLLGDEADLGGSDVVERLEQHDRDEHDRGDLEDQGEHVAGCRLPEAICIAPVYQRVYAPPRPRSERNRPPRPPPPRPPVDDFHSEIVRRRFDFAPRTFASAGSRFLVAKSCETLENACGNLRSGGMGGERAAAGSDSRPDG